MSPSPPIAAPDAPVDPAFAGRRILVAGGAGLVGTHLTRRLVEAGAAVTATIHRTEPPSPAPGATYVRADLRDVAATLPLVQGADYVFLVAASTGGITKITGQTGIVTDTMRIALSLLEAAVQAGSTAHVTVAGSTTMYPPIDGDADEAASFDSDPYPAYAGIGWMYRFIEKFAGHLHATRGLPSALVRLTNVYGPHDRFAPPDSHVLPALMHRAVMRETPFTVWGDGTELRDFIHVDDAVEGLMRAAVFSRDASAFNIGAGQAVSVGDALALILKLADHDGVEVVRDLTKPRAIPRRSISIAKARSVLGYAPRVDLASGLKRTIDWYRASLKGVV